MYNSYTFTGQCNTSCARLTEVNNRTTVPVHSTVILHAITTVNLLPGDDSTFVVLKDGIHFNSSCLNYTTITGNSITFSICNAQPEDSGVYQLMHISRHAELLTNGLLIEIIDIGMNSTISPSTSKELYNYNMYMHM